MIAITAGVAVVVLGLAGLLVDRMAVRLGGALVSLGCGGSLLFIAVTPMRGLTPPLGQPSPGPEPVSFMAGLTCIAFALAIALRARGHRVGRRAP